MSWGCGLYAKCTKEVDHAKTFGGLVRCVAFGRRFSQQALLWASAMSQGQAHYLDCEEAGSLSLTKAWPVRPLDTASEAVLDDAVTAPKMVGPNRCCNAEGFWLSDSWASGRRMGAQSSSRLVRMMQGAEK